MNFLSWILEFCTTFYSIYTSCEPEDIEDILTTVTTAATIVGTPNAYIEKNDIENFKTSTMYVQSLSDEELAKFKQKIDLEEITYQDDSTNDINLGNSKTMQ